MSVLSAGVGCVGSILGPYSGVHLLWGQKPDVNPVLSK